MKQFCCGDVVPGCKATFRAETEQDLFAKIAVHAKNDHGLLEIPAALIAQVRASIREIHLAV